MKTRTLRLESLSARRLLAADVGTAEGEQSVTHECVATHVPENVNRRDGVTPLDALLVINYLNRRSNSLRDGTPLPNEKDLPENVNGDDHVSPLDALLVINFLNRRSNAGGNFNGRPCAVDATITATEGKAFELTLEGHDPDGDDVFFQINSPPLNGALTGEAPNLVYTPNDGFVGTDSISFQVLDNNSRSETATIEITVVADNGGSVDPPTGAQNPKDGPITVDAGGVAQISLSVEGDDGNFFYRITDHPLNGELVADVDFGPTYVYTPNDGFSGQDKFRWQFNAGEAWSEQFEAVINVIATEPTQPSISLAALTPPPENLFVNGSYHVGTFDLTGENSSITFKIEEVGTEGFASFYLTTPDGERLSNDTATDLVFTIDFLEPFSGNQAYVWTNTSDTPVTYGGALRATHLNDEVLAEPTDWTALHRVNPAE